MPSYLYKERKVYRPVRGDTTLRGGNVIGLLLVQLLDPTIDLALTRLNPAPVILHVKLRYLRWLHL